MGDACNILYFGYFTLDVSEEIVELKLYCVDLDESLFFLHSSGKTKAAKAAATVLSNMFQYKKLHNSYKQVRKLSRSRTHCVRSAIKMGRVNQ